MWAGMRGSASEAWAAAESGPFCKGLLMLMLLLLCELLRLACALRPGAGLVMQPGLPGCSCQAGRRGSVFYQPPTEDR